MRAHIKRAKRYPCRAAGMSGCSSRVIGFHRDEERHWVADLDCGHTRHFRHNPPWVNHPWVVTVRGRAAHMGLPVECVTCAGGDPPQLPA